MNVAQPITDQEVEQFQRHGAACLRQVFEPEWLDLVAAGTERNLAAPSQYAEKLKDENDTGAFFDDYCNWRRIPEFCAYVHDSPAAQVAALLMRSTRAIFYHEHLLVKQPGTHKQTPWHHDQPYYPVDGWQVCSLWMPLDPVPQNACIQFVKGSHNWGRFFVPRKFKDARNYPFKDPHYSPSKDQPLYESVPEIEAQSGCGEILCWDLEPGDCIAFHMLTLHGAPGNTSLQNPRRALATRWLGDDARFAERPWEISPPATGGLEPGDPMACDEFPVVWPPA